jgi:hypothetical protein
MKRDLRELLDRVVTFSISTIVNALLFVVVALSALALDFFATKIFGEAPSFVGVSLRVLEYALLAFSIAAFLIAQGFTFFKFVRSTLLDREQSHDQ